MPLDSDVPNADTLLDVKFYLREDGPNKGKPYCRIMTPGDQTNIIDQPVRDDHKARFPRHWLYFQMEANPDEGAYGTPLEDWNKERPDELNKDQLAELHILKFRVVEQLAQASDKQLQRIGMGGPGLRERARSYLSSRNQTAASKELEDMKRELAALREQITAPSGKPPKEKVHGINASTTRTANNR